MCQWGGDGVENSSGGVGRLQKCTQESHAASAKNGTARNAAETAAQHGGGVPTSGDFAVSETASSNSCSSGLLAMASIAPTPPSSCGDMAPQQRATLSRELLAAAVAASAVVAVV